MTITTRFAPSPTGPLHLGHAFAAFVAHDMARATAGRFLLRIDDIDRTRARATYETGIYSDLAGLGLTWDGPVMRQSERTDRYRDAVETLWQAGLVYPCTCSRRDIAEAATAPQEGSPVHGPDGIVYPGTCRSRRRTGHLPRDAALRLDMRMALDCIDTPIRLVERNRNLTRPAPEIVDGIGDIVLSRKDFPGSYHLAVVLDDADQGVTLVTRGEDLFEATWIHVVLQQLLSLPSPRYHHHALVRDETGRRLAKRDDAKAVARYLADGASPAELRRLTGAPRPCGGFPAS